MARYRKIDTRIQNDEKFRKLSDDAQLVFFLLLTHPHMTSIGAMRATLPGLAAEKGWDAKRYSKAFREASVLRMAEHDQVAGVVWLPNFIKYNEPENPNVLKAWAGAIELLPECDLTRRAIQSVKDYAEGLSEPFRKALPEVFRQPSRQPSLIPEQEQEPKPEQEPKKGNTRTRATAIPDGFAVSARVSEWAKGKGFDRLDEHLEAFTRKAAARGYTYVDWDAAFMEAVREDWAGIRSGRGNHRDRAAPGNLAERNRAAADEAIRELEGRS